MRTYAEAINTFHECGIDYLDKIGRDGKTTQILITELNSQRVRVLVLTYGPDSGGYLLSIRGWCPGGE